LNARNPGGKEGMSKTSVQQEILLVLLLTSGRDPGIVPRNAHPPEPEDIGESPDWPGGQHGSTGLPLTRDVLVNGVSVKVKY